jgi:hypothetical protein
MSLEKIFYAVGLEQKYVCKEPNFYFWDKNEFRSYTEPSYYESENKEMDEVYRMHESVLLHYSSGIRFVMLTSENYYGDEVTYTLCRPFIKSLDGERYSLEAIDFTYQQFITDEGKISFDQVNKN